MKRTRTAILALAIAAGTITAAHYTRDSDTRTEHPCIQVSTCERLARQFPNDDVIYYPPCAHEDSPGPCGWVSRHGGRSFYVTADQTVHYLPASEV